MPDSFRCPRGHEWRPATAGAACPECGAAGETVHDADDPITGDELPPPPGTWPLPPGRTATSLPTAPAIEGYEVEGELGRGGMGVVYRARQRSLNRSVALKVLLPEAGELTRIRTEAEAIARLQHPNVVHVYEVGEQGGSPFLLMEFVDGGTLADRVRRGPVLHAQAAAWAEAIARGAHAAHRRGIVHRDLKPANVLMTADGVPKITDFGIARRLDASDSLTRTGAVLGTPSYMAPEQAVGRGKSAGPAADVWAIGVILYEMLAGRTPFAGSSAIDVLHGVVYEPALPPSRVRADTPPGLEAICLKCLEKRPEDRYASAEAVADDLARWQTERHGMSPRIDRAFRRWWLAAGSAALVGIAVLIWGLAGWPSVQRNEAGTAPAGGPSAAEPNPAPAGTADPSEPPRPGQPGWERFRIGGEDEGFQQIAFPTRDTGFAASRTGVYRTDDGGQTWRKAWARDLGAVYFLSFDDPDHGWLGADRLYRTANGGQTWDTVSLPDGDRVSAVRAGAFGPEGWGLIGGAAANALTLFARRTAAGGWEKLDPNAIGLRQYQDWTLGGLAVSGPREAWAVLSAPGPEKGVLMRTTDGGSTWQTAFSTDTYLFHVHFADARTGWLAGFRGTLWRTQDGGVAWTRQENPAGDATVSRLAFARGQSVGLAPLWKGRVLRTDDGRSWRSDETGLEYATPAAAVVDPGRAFVLGSDGWIARYTDPAQK